MAHGEMMEVEPAWRVSEAACSARRPLPVEARRPSRLWALCVAGLLVMGFGCGSDDAADAKCAETTSTGIDKKAAAALNDESGSALAAYSFDANSIKERKFAFLLTNTANLISAAPLRIKAISMSETDTTGKTVTKALFRCEGPNGKPCAPGAMPPVIPSGFKDAACTPEGAKTGASFTVIYSHVAGESARKAVLRLELEGDPERSTINIDFSTTLGKPKMTCDAAVIDFGSVKANGAEMTETFNCRSVGTAPVLLSRAELFSTSAPPLTLSFEGKTVSLKQPFEGGPPISIAPQAALKITAKLGKLSLEEKIGATLKLTTNDFTRAETDIQFKANSSGPCLKPKPTSIDFGDVGVGQPKPTEVQLQGCGTEAVKVISITMAEGSSSDINLDFTTGSFANGEGPSEKDPLVVQPNGTESFRVLCNPTELGKDIAGTVKIVSANTDERTIPIICKPAKSACPVACFDVQPGLKVVPLTQLTLNSACSTASGTQVIDKRKWTVKQPKISKAAFTPNPTAKTVQLTPLIAGKYEFSLTVYDDLGNPSCKPLTQVVEVVPDNKLHIELTWTTPGDPTPGDNKGADLDLHLAHPLGGSEKGQPDLDGNKEPDPWWSICYDCFWLNPKPEWGDPFDVADNPSVDRDDKDGEGPENLSIKIPETETWYTISAYVWHDANFGHSIPRIRIYIDKELVFDKTGPKLNTHDMWCVGQISYDPLATTTNAKVKLIKECPGADSAGNLLTPKYPPVSATKSLKCL